MTANDTFIDTWTERGRTAWLDAADRLYRQIETPLPSQSIRVGPLSVFIAGGGVKGGTVIGASDKNGAYPADNPQKPENLAATIYTALGVPLHTWFKAQDGRPIELCPEGKPVRQLLG